MEKPLDSPPEPHHGEGHRAQSRARIVVTAERMLAGECSYLEGSRIISDLLIAAGIDRHAPPFMVFVAIESQTDHIPLGSVRELRSPDARARLTPDWNEWEAWARETGEAVCREIIAILSSQTGSGDAAG